MAMLVFLIGLTLLQATPTPAVPAPLDISVPTVPGVAADPTCGGRLALTTIATCLATTQADIERAVDVLNAAFVEQGWMPVDGRENRIVYVKRKTEGGCDAFQVLAFAGESEISAPTEPAYLALAAIPGDICAAAPTAGTDPQP